MTRGARRRIAPGVYRDDIGYAAVVSVGSGKRRQSQERRFPAGTALRTITDWQTGVRAQFKRQAKRQTIHDANTAGTLRDDVQRYLALASAMPSAESRAYDLAAWVAVHGQTRTLKLTPDTLIRTHQAWAADGYAPSTLNHRRNALVQVYRHLYPTAENPARLIPHTREPKGDARNVDPADVLAVLEAMRPSATRARLKVMAATGLSQARIKRVTPADLDLKARTMRLVGRRKGDGTAGRVFPLSTRGVAAWREFTKYRAWGDFANEGLPVSLRRGIEAVNVARRKVKGLTLVPDFIPYQLRHTFGTELYRVTGDIRMVAELLDCTVTTALRYTRGAVDPGMAAAVAALDRMARKDGTR